MSNTGLTPNCNSMTQYFNEEIGECCDRCPPGMFATRRCSYKSKTRCQQCSPGTYTEVWNYAKTCRRCRTCGLDLQVEINCSTTQNTICGCLSGYVCQSNNGNCEECIPDAITPTGLSQATQPTTQKTIEISSLITGRSVWIIALPLGIFFLLSIGIIIIIKTSIWKPIAQECRRKQLNKTNEHEGQNAGVKRHQTFPLLPIAREAESQQPKGPILQPESESLQCKDMLTSTCQCHGMSAAERKCCTGSRILHHNCIIVGELIQCSQNHPADSECLSIPYQEEGKSLHFPIEETQPPQSSKYSFREYATPE
ncbi:CD27 antigen isoform X2 [Spea bombifrons]|nr:CD27 antigen isoform X2 [Spea bombifrons]